MRINNNIAAANAQRNLAATRDRIETNVERLSTGLRINRAGDDASGLVISNQLRAQVSGLKQASRNAQDGISVLQTAEGALDQVNVMLQRMRDLAVQASNSGTNGQSARDAGQAELDALRTEIDRVANTTKFGSVNLLDNTFGSGGGTATVAGYDSDNSYVLTSTSNSLTLTFGGVSTAGAVTATLTATTYTGANMATEVQAKLRSALLAGTSAQQALADKVTVSSTTVGGGSTLTVSVAGLASGSNITFSGTAVSVAGATGLSTAASANTTNSGARFQVGSGTSSNEQITFVISGARASDLGISSIAINTNDATTTTAITTLDTAITTVSTLRGNLGALQNRFESMTVNLATTTENLQASESRIRDVDMASEMVEFTKNQVLSQAGTAMLSQANQIPQGILSLLKG